jgi:hypothetical protein
VLRVIEFKGRTGLVALAGRGITQYPGLGPDLITSRPDDSPFVPIGS